MGEKFNIVSDMTVTVTLVVGRDGSTSKDGTSAGVSNNADRSAFLARRRSADCIMIGGSTARLEPYHRTPVPVIVISRSLMNPLSDNRFAHCWNLSPIAALDRAIETFGPEIHVESGISIVSQLIDAGRVDLLELSITDVVGGDHRIDIDGLLEHFTIVRDDNIDGTRFVSGRSKK